MILIHHQGRWVAGVISGLMTRTKVLGFIGAIPIYQGFSDANALLLGARTVCPDCKVQSSGMDQMDQICSFHFNATHRLSIITVETFSSRPKMHTPPNFSLRNTMQTLSMYSRMHSTTLASQQAMACLCLVSMRLKTPLLQKRS